MEYYIHLHENLTELQISEINKNKTQKNIIVFNENNITSLKQYTTTIIKIIIINSLIVTHNLSQFNYIIPKNINIYLKLKKKSDLLGKILCPININFNNNYYCESTEIKNIINDIVYTNNIHDADIILYEKTEDLNNTLVDNLSNTVLFKYDKKQIEKSIINIKSLINLINYSKKNSLENIKNYLSNIKKQNIVRIDIEYQHNDVFDIKKGNIYIFSRKGAIINDSPIVSRRGVLIDISMLDKLYNDIYNNAHFTNSHTSCYLISSTQEKEPLIIHFPLEDKKISLYELIKSIDYQNDISVGSNKTIMNDDQIIDYYSFLGKFNEYFGNNYISIVYNNYLDLIFEFRSNCINNCHNKMYDKYKFMRMCSYWYGLNDIYLDKNLLLNFMSNEFIFKTKKIMLLCKNMSSYGGNQKVSLQIYYILIKNGYNVEIVCINNFDVFNNVHNNDAKVYTLLDLPELVNNRFDLIIVNKLNEYFKINNLIKKHDIVITHNSLDPFNNLLTNDVSKIFTVNIEHISILNRSGLTIPISQHINYIDIHNKVNKRNNFTNNVIFIGRLSREKNLDILIESWKEINKINNDIKLFIVGSGDEKYIRNNENVIYFGQCDFDTILLLLEKSDYLILPSYTEGLPFSVLESMSVGIPAICSNIIGCNSLIVENETGFLFDLQGYDDHKYNITDTWEIFNEVDKFKEENIKSIKNCVLNAYSINIDQWNDMSEKCYNFVATNYSKTASEQKLLINIHELMTIENSNK